MRECAVAKECIERNATGLSTTAEAFAVLAHVKDQSRKVENYFKCTVSLYCVKRAKLLVHRSFATLGNHIQDNVVARRLLGVKLKSAITAGF